MKSVLLVLLFAGLACAANVESNDNSTVVERPQLPRPTEVANNATECVYSVKDNRLSCRDLEENVECEASLEYDGERAFGIFGIERCNNKKIVAAVVSKVVRGVAVDVVERNKSISEEDVASYKFNLFPRRLDNETYLPSEQVINGSNVRFALYYGEKRVDQGIRVEKLACWNRLVRIFKQASERHSVVVQDKDVVLFGEILIRDKQVSKRWFYGFGFLPYAHLWGWGGYPYGAFYGRK